MDRIRLGLTGLAAILAIVFIASSAMRSDGNRADQSPTAGETLSVIGVAPKIDDDAAAEPDPPPPPPTAANAR